MLKTLQSKQLHAAGDWQSVNVENPAKIKRIDNILRSVTWKWWGEMGKSQKKDVVWSKSSAHLRVWLGLGPTSEYERGWGNKSAGAWITIEIVGGIGPGMKCAEKFSQRKRCFKPSYAHSLASVLLYAFRSREKEYCLFCGFFQLEKPICYWESRHLLAPLMSQLVTFSNCSPGVIVVWVIFSHWSVGPLTIEILNLEVFGFVLDVHSPIVWKLALIPIWEE